MSKKIMKRSLALGVLMAFVITGSAWAAEYNDKVYDGQGITSSNTSGGALNLSSGENSITNSKFYNNVPKPKYKVQFGKEVLDKTTSKGGAVYINDSTTTIVNNDFINNNCTYWGGAIAVDSSKKTDDINPLVTIKGTNVFKENTSNSGGGAIAVNQGKMNFGDDVYSGVESYTLFEKNISKGSEGYNYGGGAILIPKDGGNAELNFYSNVDFKNNLAHLDGGAIHNQSSSGVINFVSGTATFEGNKAGVTFADLNGTVVGTDGDDNDIYNAGTINIGKDATVILDGGITGGWYTTSTSYGGGNINIKGVLEGKLYSTGIKNTSVTVAQNVVLDNGVWNLVGEKSNVNTLSGLGKLKVDLTNAGEYVQVQNPSIQRASSNIEIDYGGIIGVDVKQGVENYSKKIVDASGKALVDVTKIGDVFLQANVQVEESDGVRNITTTIKPGDDFVIESDVTATGDVKAGNVSLKATAEALNSKANQVDVEAALDLKVDKTALEAEATTREKVDVGLQEQIDNLSTGSNEAIAGVNQRLGKMNGKINKVGAGAAALAALHPLDYDPDDKLTFSAGVGNYAGENAAALGAFYRPDEKLMFSLGGTMGNGENMVNLGVSIGLDGAKGAPKLSRKELVEKVNIMEAENANMKAEIAELKALVAELAKRK